MTDLLKTSRKEWDKVFETFCETYGCPKQYYKGVLSSYAGDHSEFICRNYVRHITDTAASKTLYCPEMSDVAGNVITFYTRWHVSLLNEEFTSFILPFSLAKKTNLTKCVDRLERRYIRRPFVSSYPRLYAQGLLTDTFMRYVKKFGGTAAVESLLNGEPHLEYGFDCLAMRTATEVYMLRAPSGEPMETLGEAFLRVALHLHEGERERVSRTFDDLINKRCMFATPVIMNSGLSRATNVSSCFLMGLPRVGKTADLFDTIGSVAMCLENNGGVGLSLTHVNARRYGGLINVMKLLNETVNALKHNDSGRPGAVAVYLEPWHPDVCDFLDARKNHGDERKRCRDLFTALWVPDIFMKRVHAKETWSLFDPESEGGRQLLQLHGTAFEDRYRDLEARGLYTARVSARMLWTKMLKSQINTGTPYVLYKDSCVGKSVHRSLGPIGCSNLCTEVVQFSTHDQIATCKLASICLPAFLDGGGKELMRWDDFEATVENLVFSLNRMHGGRSKAIDGEETASAAIGIGVQGLADVLFRLNTYWGSSLSVQTNKEIFQRIYYYAVSASCQQARISDKRFRGFESTDLAKGVLQFDYWSDEDAGPLDWKTLRANVARYGTYNSLLVALMPTVTTSQITGYNESFEPVMANVYLKRTGNGEFQMINRHLVRVLRAKGKFDEDTVKRIQQHDGSVCGLTDILDEHELRVFRTVWEISPHVLMDMAADRARFVDQSQSMNLYMANPDVDTLSDLHLYGWAKGLKTGMYYLRSRPASNAIKFTLLPVNKRKPKIVCDVAQTDDSAEQSTQCDACCL